MRQTMSTLGELHCLDAGLVEQNGALEYVHRRGIQPGTEIDVPPALLRLALDHCCRGFTSEPRGMKLVVILEDPHGPGPLQRGEGGLHRATQRIIEGEQPGRLTGPKHEVRQPFRAVGKRSNHQRLSGSHRGNIRRKRGSRAPLGYQLRLRFHLDDPETGIDVRNVDQAIAVDRAPRVRGIGNRPSGVSGHHMGHFPPLT